MNATMLRFAAMTAVIFVLDACVTTSPSNVTQSRSTALGILQKTDYVINEAYQITDYFYYDDGELLAHSTYYQDYAYELYDARQYYQAIQYSLRAREYAINAIEICDDYWEYYDYTYYGRSTLYGINPNYNRYARPSVQLHFSIRHAAAHDYRRVNWNLYFTSAEWEFYHALPLEAVMLNQFYQARGRILFNDRFHNPGIYNRMLIRINTGHNAFMKKYPNMVQYMAPRPANIRPQTAIQPNTSGARRQPTNTQSQTTVREHQSRTSENRSGTNGNVQSRSSSNSNVRNTQSSGNTSTRQSNSATTRQGNEGTTRQSNNVQNQSQTGRSNTRSSSGSTRTTRSSRSTQVDNQTNQTQERQAKRENTTRSTSTRGSSTGTRSSSSSTRSGSNGTSTRSSSTSTSDNRSSGTSTRSSSRRQ